MKVKNKVATWGVVFVVFSSACSFSSDSKEEFTNQNEDRSEVDFFINSIEEAHNIKVFKQKEVIQFDMNLVMGGKLHFDGKVSMSPDEGLVRMQDSVKTMVWDGSQAFLSPDTSTYSKTRFDLLTWSYFFAAPYKLSDPGTNHELLGKMPLNETNYEAVKLTFQEGVGDSPDDWYIVYKDQSTDLLAAMAYIVTYSKNPDQAEENPHVITYEAFEKVGGVPFATQWNFWTWNERGEMNKLVGEAVISNITFIKKAEGLFQPPAQSKIAEKPEV